MRNNVAHAMTYIVEQLSKGTSESDLNTGYDLYSRLTFDNAKKKLMDRNVIQSRKMLDGNNVYLMK